MRWNGQSTQNPKITQWIPWYTLLFGIILCWTPQMVFATDKHEGSHGDSHGSAIEKPSSATVGFIDIDLLDQEGRKVNFQSEVVGHKIVVVNFIYTTCTTQCPLSSQVLAGLQQELKTSGIDNVQLVSVSLDPVIDTPARLRDFAEKVGSDPQWTWLTGKNSGVMRLLDGLGVYSPDIISHPPVFLVGDGKNKRWKRFNGLPSVEQLQSYIRELQKSRTLLKQNSGYQIIRVHTSEDKDEKARGYFTDLPVITHDGQTLNFYTDLLKNKIVLINLFFSGCEKSCPMVHSKLSKLQNELDGYLGKSVFFISITIDPEPDTPDIMKHYAQSFKPKPGWSFVTGSPENIKTITYRLGQINDDKEAHAPFLMVGDVSNVRWKKFLPNISNEMLARFIKNLAADHSSTHLE